MDCLISLGEVERRTSLKKSKLYTMMKAGEFPRAKIISPGRRAWLASEIQAWIAQRVDSPSAATSDATSNIGG